MLSHEQRTAIADRIFYELMPEGGQAWPTAELTAGIADAADVEHADLRGVLAALARDHKLAANPVNGLWFRQAAGSAAELASFEDARKFRPRLDRPAAGIRVQLGADDPFAVLALSGAGRRVAVGQARYAGRLQAAVESGRLSPDARDLMITTVQEQGTKAVTGELANVVRRILPAA